MPVNPTLDDISKVIGFSKTAVLSAWFGGEKIYVPDAVEDGQPLVNVLGLRAATLICQAWGNEHLSIPNLASYEAELRLKRVYVWARGGSSVTTIASLEKVSKKRVKQIIQELEAHGILSVNRVVPIEVQKHELPALHWHPGFKWTAEKLQELRDYHAVHGRKATADKYGISGTQVWRLRQK